MPWKLKEIFCVLSLIFSLNFWIIKLFQPDIKIMLKYTINTMEQKIFLNLSNMSRDNGKFLAIHVSKFEFKVKYKYEGDKWKSSSRDDSNE